MVSPDGYPSQQGGEQAKAMPTVAESHPGVLHRAGGAVLHFFTEQIQTPANPGLSEHFGHAGKRNDLNPSVELPERRLKGRH